MDGWRRPDLRGRAAAMFTGPWIRAFLYGVTFRDPLTYVLVSVVVILTSAVAILAPAVRAAHVEPMAALRYE
jgi:ABC-type antimicrobial peptide transport system permease subunit